MVKLEALFLNQVTFPLLKYTYVQGAFDVRQEVIMINCSSPRYNGYFTPTTKPHNSVKNIFSDTLNEMFQCLNYSEIHESSTTLML